MAGDGEEGIVFLMIYSLFFFFQVMLFSLSSYALCYTCSPSDLSWDTVAYIKVLIINQRKSPLSIYAIPSGSLKNLYQQYALGRVLPPM